LKRVIHTTETYDKITMMAINQFDSVRRNTVEEEEKNLWSGD